MNQYLNNKISLSPYLNMHQIINSNFYQNVQMAAQLKIFEDEDIYPYIKEEKINITFNINNKKKKTIKIPCTLRKNELYYTAEVFLYDLNDDDYYTGIELYYKNKLLNNDDSLIENISNDDIINIISGADNNCSIISHFLKSKKILQKLILFFLLLLVTKRLLHYKVILLLKKCLILFFI